MAEFCGPWNTYNITDETVADGLAYNDFDRLNILVLTPCIIGFGILSNSAFLYTVSHVQQMQTVTNFYLSALAICDIILLSSGPTLLIASYVNTVGEAFSLFTDGKQCIAIFSVTAASYYSSLGIISLMSTEKCYALYSPLRHRAIASKNRTIKLIFGAIAFGFIFTVINVPSYAVIYKVCYIWPDAERFDDMPTVGNNCGPISLTYYIYQELFTILLFTISLIYNTLLYVLIIVALSNRGVSEESNSTSQSQQVRNQVARVLVLNGLVFFICQFPYR